MGAPQVILTMLIAISLVIALFKHKEKAEIHFGWTFVNKVILVALLLWGGFYS